MQRKDVLKHLVQAKQRGLCVFLSFSQRDAWGKTWETSSPVVVQRCHRTPCWIPPTLTVTSRSHHLSGLDIPCLRHLRL